MNALRYVGYTCQNMRPLEHLVKAAGVHHGTIVDYISEYMLKVNRLWKRGERIVVIRMYGAMSKVAAQVSEACILDFLNWELMGNVFGGREYFETCSISRKHKDNFAQAHLYYAFIKFMATSHYSYGLHDFAQPT